MDKKIQVTTRKVKKKTKKIVGIFFLTKPRHREDTDENYRIARE